MDGGGTKPGYSLRTLCRALAYARDALPVYGLLRSLYDGVAMAFATQLAPSCSPTLERLLRTRLLPNTPSLKVILACVILIYNFCIVILIGLPWKQVQSVERLS